MSQWSVFERMARNRQESAVPFPSKLPADIYTPPSGLGNPGGFQFPSYIPMNAYQQRPIMQQPLGMGNLGLPPEGSPGIRGRMMQAILQGWMNPLQMPMPPQQQGQMPGQMQFPEQGGIPPWMML